MYFFMVPPGEVVSPFFSTALAVPAPCMLASFGEGLELPVVAPFFIAPPPAVVLSFKLLPAGFGAGPPECELPPTVLRYASAAVLASAKAAANEMDFIFVSWLACARVPRTNYGCRLMFRHPAARRRCLPIACEHPRPILETARRATCQVRP
jgi:hypothetical protein